MLPHADGIQKSHTIGSKKDVNLKPVFTKNIILLFTPVFLRSNLMTVDGNSTVKKSWWKYIFEVWQLRVRVTSEKLDFGE